MRLDHTFRLTPSLLKGRKGWYLFGVDWQFSWGSQTWSFCSQTHTKQPPAFTSGRSSTLKTSLSVRVSSGNIISFQIASWLQYIVENGLKQVEIAYLVVMSHLVWPSYMLSTWTKPRALPRGLLARLSTLSFRMTMLSIDNFRIAKL